MSISRLLNEVRPLFQLLEEPLTRSPAFYARPQRMLLGDPFRSPFGGLGTLGGRPAVDVIEEGDKYVVAADLPGVKKEDVEVRVAEDGRSITIEGKMVEVPMSHGSNTFDNTGYIGETGTSGAVSRGETTSEIARERFYSVNAQFERTVWLPRPINAETVTAKLQDGVLRVTANKAEDKASKVVAVE
ncbi:HSP20-like chaperone [Amanita rubescens]|nr:HSP20-like chaperone [Amanita rubescens]